MDSCLFKAKSHDISNILSLFHNRIPHTDLSDRLLYPPLKEAHFLVPLQYHFWCSLRVLFLLIIIPLFSGRSLPHRKCNDFLCSLNLLQRGWVLERHYSNSLPLRLLWDLLRPRCSQTVPLGPRPLKQECVHSCSLCSHCLDVLVNLSWEASAGGVWYEQLQPY